MASGERAVAKRQFLRRKGQSRSGSAQPGVRTLGSACLIAAARDSSRYFASCRLTTKTLSGIPQISASHTGIASTTSSFLASGKLDQADPGGALAGIDIAYLFTFSRLGSSVESRRRYSMRQASAKSSRGLRGHSLALSP